MGLICVEKSTFAEVPVELAGFSAAATFVSAAALVPAFSLPHP
jgi:hypothetical protein